MELFGLLVYQVDSTASTGPLCRIPDQQLNLSGHPQVTIRYVNIIRGLTYHVGESSPLSSSSQNGYSLASRRQRRHDGLNWSTKAQRGQDMVYEGLCLSRRSLLRRGKVSESVLYLRNHVTQKHDVLELSSQAVS